MNTPAPAPVLRRLARDSETYRFVFEGSYQGVLLVGAGIEDCNDAACRLLGQTRERLIGADPLTLAPAMQRDGSPSAIAARQRVSAALEGHSQWFEWRFLRQDGSTVDTLLNLEALEVDGARRLLLRLRDVSQLERSEEALHSAALAISTAEGDAVFRDLVRHLAQCLETDLAFIALPSENAPTRLRMLAFYLDGKLIEDFEYPIAGTACETVLGQEYRLYPSGLAERFPLDDDFKALGVDCYAGYPLTDANGGSLGLIAVVARKPFRSANRVESLLKIFAGRAVTEIERHRANRALRASEGRYRLLFEMESDAILLIDVESLRIVDANRAALDLYGYSPAELAELTAPALSVDPELTALTIRSQDSGTARVPLRYHRKKDGSTFPAEIATNTFDLAGRPTILAAIRDITARVEQEQSRRRLEAQLRQAQKMEAIGQLTGGIAHDFNNILTSILGYIALATDRPSATQDVKLDRYLTQAEAAARRARDLIQQMLTFSRGQRGEPRPVTLGPLLRNAITLLRSTLPATMGLDTRIARDIPQVMLDPVHLEQVLLNLCINARDAMQGTGEIEIGARVAEVLEEVCASCRQPVNGCFVELAVCDNGSGISPEVSERMFEPFFTTKEVGKGSGMGLATVHGIVHEYGGHICVDTGLGRGTRFRVMLQPLTSGQGDAQSTAEPAAPGSKSVVRLRGSVLVVEDEEAVGAVIGEMLQTWGLSAIVIRNPVEAERWFLQDPARVDLVLTDQTMPKVTGLELAQRLTLVRPDLPVLLYTGYGNNITAEQAARSGICAVIAKPVEPAILVEVLRAHLPGLDAHDA